MQHLTLSCPTCGKWLVHIPLEGLTLHYRCAEHGVLTFRPLVLLTGDEQSRCGGPAGSQELHAHDAA